MQSGTHGHCRQNSGAELVGRGPLGWALLFTPVVMNKREEHCGTTTEKCFNEQKPKHLAVPPGTQASMQGACSQRVASR